MRLIRMLAVRRFDEKNNQDQGFIDIAPEHVVAIWPRKDNRTEVYTLNGMYVTKQTHRELLGIMSHLTCDCPQCTEATRTYRLVTLEAIDQYLQSE